MSITSDRNAIYSALCELEYARGVIYSQLVRGTNSSLYDWCKQSEHTLKEARAAYDRLGREGRG